ncbi:hypothetical protein QF022_002402 [Vogesella perlucida]|nr:hypothetical protein [Vogesella perlucida]
MMKNKIIYLLGKAFTIFLIVFFKWLLFPFMWIFSNCVQPLRFHKLLIWLAFLWHFYLIPEHGHVWYEYVACNWGVGDCGRYAPPTAAEIWWRQTYMRPLLILAALASTNFYIQHVKREIRLRRQLANDPDMVIPLPWWKPKWFDKYFWWL